MSKVKSKYLSIIIFCILIVISLFGYTVFFVSNINIKANKRFYISKTSTFEDILLSLEEKKLINNSVSFYLASHILGYKNRIRSGSYILEPKMNNWQLIRKLRAGLQKPVKLVLHNIKSKNELINKICSKLDISFSELDELLCDCKTLHKFGFNPENILVMFIPNTYHFYWNISPKKFFTKMYKEYKKFWNKERLKKAECIKLTPIEVSILASLVQAETIKNDEASIIAGIYRNRLRKKMRLMSDPTLKFATGNYKANRILKIDKAIDSQYNTYKNFGLPPGPISIPEIKNIEAVLNLKQHQYLFFCAKDNFSGEHYFSKNFKQHLIYARKYWRALNRSKIFR